MESIKKAVIFNIARYSIHDGPGIRTTVFFKGCPLSCKWCHNPESRSAGGTEYEITAADLIKEIAKDSLFFEQSGGGVTFSGGEPFSQAAFLLEILALCEKERIKAAIDTCGYCETETLLKAAEKTNLFLYDIKFIDSDKHEKYCGVKNDLILSNLKALSETKTKLLIRVPVIPSINDDIPEMAGIFEFIKDFKNIETVHLLPYHNIQIDKYKRLGIQYELSDISGDESRNMKAISRIFEGRFRAKVGG